jgi:hypothetical protein
VFYDLYVFFYDMVAFFVMMMFCFFAGRLAGSCQVWGISCVVYFPIIYHNE